MKVGILSRFVREGDGISIYSENLAKDLENFVQVVRIGDVNSDSADCRVNFRSFSLKSSLQRIIEEEKLDVLHIQYIAGYFGKHTLNLNLLKALSQKIPVVCTMHEVHYSYEGLGFFRKKVLEFLQRNVVKNASLVIVHTPQQKKFLFNEYEAENIESVHHGLDIHENKTKQAIGNILFFGMISRNKGLELLLEAMNLLPDYKLKVVGKFVDKRQENHIRQITENTRNVSLLSRWVSSEEKWNFFSEADVLVLPYLHAPYQSGVLSDAVSAEVPVVVTKTGSLNEIVELFKFGESVQKNPEAIANGIRKVMKNNISYRNGFADYRKEANWNAVAQKHLAIYEKVVADRKS